MILTNEKVNQIIKDGPSLDMLMARKISKALNTQITGRGVKTYLEKLDQYENQSQKILREKLVKSNRAVFSFVLRPLDKVFTAKGGSVNYNLQENEVNVIRDVVSDVSDGLSIKRYLKKVILKKYIIDPNGIMFVDYNPIDDKLETHYVSSDNILWYANKGNKIGAIVFEGETKNNETTYRVIDDQTDRIFTKNANSQSVLRYVEDTAKTLVNTFGFVPAMVLGDLKNPNYNVFDSFISDVEEEARELLRDVSVNTVHKLAHGYAKYWQRPEACTRCGGESVIKIPTDDPDVFDEETCPSCGGLGHKKKFSPSDVMIVPVPEKDEVDPAPNVAGYVNPSIEIWKTYDKNIDKSKNYIFMVLWGTTFEQGGKNETATGRFLDSQPVQDRLRDVSHTFSLFHTFLLDCYGIYALNQKDYRSSVAYGTRYIIESPDEILNKVMEATRDNVGDMVMFDLTRKYFQTEYQNDDLELSKKEKILRVDPFPNMDVKTVTDNEFITTEDKLKKIYFVSWILTLSDAKIILSTVGELKADLTQFVEQKKLVNE